MAVAAKRRRSSTVRDMVLSLAVVGAIIGLFVALLPKTAHQKVTVVPYLQIARTLAQDSSLPIFVPSPIPKGWQPNYVRVGEPPDLLHVGFVLDSTRFARLDETAKADAAFYRDSNVSTTAGTSTAAGFEVRRSGSQVALVRQLPGGGALTLSDGGISNGASLAELVSLAQSLREVR